MKTYGVTNHTNPLPKYFQMVPLVFDNFQLQFIFSDVSFLVTLGRKNVYTLPCFSRSLRGPSWITQRCSSSIKPGIGLIKS